MSVFSISELPVGATVHMVGIGGISMSALASMLLHFGYKVTGSDRKKSDLTDELEAKGVKISTDQSAGDIGHPNLVCYTAAIAADNPELVTAHNAGIPTIERAELLGALMELYKYPIAVAGTHGKTTTTSMLAPTCVNSEGCFTFFVQERSEMWMRPSTPSSSSTKIPKLVKLRTFAVCLLPTGYLTSIASHGSSLSCLMPRDILRSARSSVRITASTSSPTWRNSCAERRCWLQLISETWIRPSTPGAISTNAP